MRALHRAAVLLSAAALTACAKSGDTRDTASAAGSTPAPAPAAPATPAPIALGDLAGKWQMKATPEGGTDTTSTNFVLTATADTTGWTLTFPNRKPVALHVVASGDSIVANSEPYESVRRKGVQVTTNSVFRVQNGQLAGMTMAHYKSKGADSVLHLRTQGTRAP